MKALSLLQPWATLVAIGAKRVETRSWPTHHRGALAICASKKFRDADRFLCLEDPFRHTLANALYDGDVDIMRRCVLHDETVELNGKVYMPLPAGCVVANTVVRACMPALIVMEEVDPKERAFGWYAADRFAWLLDDTIQVQGRYPVRGMPGLYDLPAEIARAVDEELGACVQ